MISNSDFEKLWILYKTEGEPKGVSINAFCSRGINYREFFDKRNGKAERNNGIIGCTRLSRVGY